MIEHIYTRYYNGYWHVKLRDAQFKPVEEQKFDNIYNATIFYPRKSVPISTK